MCGGNKGVLSGHEFVGIKGQFLSKGNWLSVSNPNAYQIKKDCVCVPVDCADTLNIGCLLKEMQAHCADNQKFIHCKHSLKAQTIVFLSAGIGHILFNPNQPMGINAPGKLLLSMSKAAGITD